MKIKPFFILFCILVIIAQKFIFSDAITVIAGQYPLMIFIFPLIILAMPMNTEKPILLITAFVTGLILDVLNDTLGINAFALVMLAFFRGFILDQIQPRQGYKTGLASFRKYGLGWMSIYLIASLLIFTFTYFMIDAFTFHFIKKVLVCTVLSTLASLPFGMFFLMIFKTE